MNINEMTAKTYSYPSQGLAKTKVTNQTVEMQEQETENGFRRSLSAQLSGLRQHPSVQNAAVNITPEGLKAMQEDPEYREQVLALIQRDIGSSYAPRDASVCITVGATLDEYRGDSWSVGYDGEFQGRSANSFWKRESGKKESAGQNYIDAFNRRMMEMRTRQRRELSRKRKPNWWSRNG